jgi:hypothetical protein
VTETSISKYVLEISSGPDITACTLDAIDAEGDHSSFDTAFELEYYDLRTDLTVCGEREDWYKVKMTDPLDIYDFGILTTSNYWYNIMVFSIHTSC